VALKEPFGAKSSGYYGPQTINYFSPKMSPKVRGRGQPGPSTLAPRTIDKTIIRTSDEDRSFGLVLGNGAEVEILIGRAVSFDDIGRGIAWLALYNTLGSV
jgi:hypothetical protein